MGSPWRARAQLVRCPSNEKASRPPLRTARRTRRGSALWRSYTHERASAQFLIQGKTLCENFYRPVTGRAPSAAFQTLGPANPSSLRALAKAEIAIHAA